MPARSLVVLGNLGIREAYAVLAVTAGTGLYDGGDHLHDRQDLPTGRVRLGSTFDLGDPLVQRACPEPAECRSTGYAGIADKAITGKYFRPPRGNVARASEWVLVLGRVGLGLALGAGVVGWTRCLAQSGRRAGRPATWAASGSWPSPHAVHASTSSSGATVPGNRQGRHSPGRFTYGRRHGWN